MYGTYSINALCGCDWCISACVCLCWHASQDALKYLPMFLHLTAGWREDSLLSHLPPPTSSPLSPPSDPVPPTTHSLCPPLASCSSHLDPALSLWPALIGLISPSPLSFPPMASISYTKNCLCSTTSKCSTECIKTLMLLLQCWRNLKLL